MASLAALRRRALLSQRDLAKRAGVAPSSVYLIERGRTRPQAAVMRKLAGALGLVDPSVVDEFRQVIGNASDIDDRFAEREAATVPNAASDPVLAELWDNQEDAVYDDLAPASVGRPARASA